MVDKSQTENENITMAIPSGPLKNKLFTIENIKSYTRC